MWFLWPEANQVWQPCALTARLWGFPIILPQQQLYKESQFFSFFFTGKGLAIGTADTFGFRLYTCATCCVEKQMHSFLISAKGCYLYTAQPQTKTNLPGNISVGQHMANRLVTAVCIFCVNEEPWIFLLGPAVKLNVLVRFSAILMRKNVSFKHDKCWTGFSYRTAMVEHVACLAKTMQMVRYASTDRCTLYYSMRDQHVL